MYLLEYDNEVLKKMDFTRCIVKKRGESIYG